MSESCNHEHHVGNQSATRPLVITLVLVAIYFLAELIGGFWSGSLALLADAGHMFSDMAALGISLFAAWIATRKASPQQTFGYHRAEILAATANGASLFLVAGGILHEAWERLNAPAEILAGPMLWIAIGGLVVNLASLKVLHSGHQHNLNLRGAWLHVIGDTLGSVGVIIAAFLVWQFNWNWADPVASVLVCLLILYSSWNLLSESIGILMENAPRDVDVHEVENFIVEQPFVQSVHCLHVWLIASGLKSLSAHVVLTPNSSEEFQLHQLREQLHQRFGIEHATLQIESPDDPVCTETRIGSCLVVGNEIESHSH
ncbi:MAG: cation transporter [Planctomicrobium sp.]|nr:cation transporter [Planctomicrobium sp.]